MKNFNRYIVEKLNKLNNKSEFINGETYYFIITYVRKYEYLCQDCNFLYIRLNKGIDGYIVTNLKDVKDEFKQRDIGKYFGLFKFKKDKVKHIESFENLQKMCQEKTYNLSELCEPIDEEDAKNIF
jgi:hypothetical protein